MRLDGWLDGWLDWWQDKTRQGKATVAGRPGKKSGERCGGSGPPSFLSFLPSATYGRVSVRRAPHTHARTLALYSAVRCSASASVRTMFTLPTNRYASTVHDGAKPSIHPTLHPPTGAGLAGLAGVLAVLHVAMWWHCRWTYVGSEGGIDGDIQGRRQDDAVGETSSKQQATNSQGFGRVTRSLVRFVRLRTYCELGWAMVVWSTWWWTQASRGRQIRERRRV